MTVDFFFAKIFGKTLIEEIKREEKDTQRNISKKTYFTKIFGFPAFFPVLENLIFLSPKCTIMYSISRKHKKNPPDGNHLQSLNLRFQKPLGHLWAEDNPFHKLGCSIIFTKGNFLMRKPWL